MNAGKSSKNLFMLLGFLVGVGVSYLVNNFSYFEKTQVGENKRISEDSSVKRTEGKIVISDGEAIGKQPLTPPPDSLGWVERGVRSIRGNVELF
jgi:hypothetical protein